MPCVAGEDRRRKACHARGYSSRLGLRWSDQIGACGDVAITGGLAADIGLCRALQEKIAEEKLAMRVGTHPDSVYAGAIGAALWGAYRHRVLGRRAEVVA